MSRRRVADLAKTLDAPPPKDAAAVKKLLIGAVPNRGGNARAKRPSQRELMPDWAPRAGDGRKGPPGKGGGKRGGKPNDGAGAEGGGRGTKRSDKPNDGAGGTGGGRGAKRALGQDATPDVTPTPPP